MVTVTAKNSGNIGKKASLKKILIRSLVSIVSLLLIVLVWAYTQFRGSLPQLDGSYQFSQLSSKVEIERDENGIATITANNRADLSFATGFVHAQERFFQMDLSRRRSAGELSQLFGKVALKLDKSTRIHRLRARSTKVIEQLPLSQKQLLQRYTEGVNAGLKALSNVPFEYYLLQQEPRSWSIEDSLLTVYAMYFTLQSGDGRYEWQKFLLKDSLSVGLLDFLLPTRTEWDAPIQPELENWQRTLLPSASVLASNHKSLAHRIEPPVLPELIPDDAPLYGSNNWSVDGSISETGAAILSNDMHLGLSVPNTWYRLRLKLNNESLNGLVTKSSSLDVSGLSLPGNPLIVAGSNGYVAWGFTNSYGDWGDLIQLKINPENETQYLTKNGYQNFTEYSETIHIKDEAAQEFTVKETKWGPVVNGYSEHSMAYRWVAHYPQGINAGLLEMEQVTTVQEAMSKADKIGIPAQNAMLTDHLGNIGWTIFGAIPKRKEGDYSIPGDWSTGELDWNGWLTSSEYPKVYNPQNHRLWTANARVTSGLDLQLVGDSGYALGARAQQIRDDLTALKAPVKEQELLNIQLDNRAIFLTRWKAQLEKVLESSQQTEFTPFLKQLKNWQGLAAADSIAYRLVKEYRLQVAKVLMNELTEVCRHKHPKCDYYKATHQWEQPLWTLVSEQPGDWLPEGFSHWKGFFEEMAKRSFEPVLSGKIILENYTWGKKNQTQIKHSLSRFVPFLGKLTDMPTLPQAGDKDMPHVAGQGFGQSERMVVSPGHEERGILHMPTSQSAHPLSPYYGKGHDDWMKGIPSPFLPGKTFWKMQLNPET